MTRCSIILPYGCAYIYIIIAFMPDWRNHLSVFQVAFRQNNSQLPNVCHIVLWIMGLAEGFYGNYAEHLPSGLESKLISMFSASASKNICRGASGVTDKDHKTDCNWTRLCSVYFLNCIMFIYCYNCFSYNRKGQWKDRRLTTSRLKAQSLRLCAWY